MAARKPLRCLSYHVETGERCPNVVSHVLRLCREHRTFINVVTIAGEEEREALAAHPWRDVWQLRAMLQERGR